jgi:argininosuccinate lyase
MAAATRGGFLTATDLADYLAQGGMPFRSAHEVVGRCVAHCEKAGIKLWDLSLQELKKFSPAFGADALVCLSVEASVKSRRSQGGTAPVRVRTAVRAADRLLVRRERFVEQELKKIDSLSIG